MAKERVDVSSAGQKKFRLTAVTAKLRTIFDLESTGHVVVYSVLVGMVAGLGAAGFFWVLTWFKDIALGFVEGYYPPAAGSEPITHTAQLPLYWWAVLLVPTLGGLACGLLVYSVAPEAEGHGTDAMVRAFHSLRGKIRERVPIVKTVASILTIGTGGSAGREGPIAQIGAGFGSFLASHLKLSDRDRRMLMLAGAAGGVGAIFRAPLGGALFAVEVLYASTAIEFSAIVPCVVASVVAYSVFSSIFGTGVAFSVPATTRFAGPVELPFYLVFAVICALVGFFYVWCFYGLRDHIFRKVPLPNHVKPAIGGLLLGVMALAFPQVMAGGYGWIQEAINSQLSLRLMLWLVVVKILATSFTISSGGSGGVFAPSLFIGAMLGGAFGAGCNAMFPGVAPTPEAFVLVGMGGFFAGVAKVPLTALIMVSEMSGSYDLLVPLMVVNVTNVAILSSKWTLYEEQVPSLIDSPAHLGDYVVDVLEGMQIHEVYQPQRAPALVPEDTPLPALLQIVAASTESYFPVVDRAGLLVGIFSLHDIRSVLVGNGAGDLVLAADVARAPVTTLTPDDNLHTALRLYTQKRIEEIPIVESDNPRSVICMLRRGEVIGAYDRQMARIREKKSEDEQS
jgi:CIC family chloride channel protein